MSELKAHVPVNGKKTKQHLLVRSGKERYGIDIAYVENVVRMTEIARVPGSQPYFKGVIHVRGEVVAVMSLRFRMKLEDDLFTDDSRIVILKIGDLGSVGVIVDQVEGMAALTKEDGPNPEDGTVCCREFFAGAGRYGEERIFVLDARAIAGAS